MNDPWRSRSDWVWLGRLPAIGEPGVGTCVPKRDGWRISLVVLVIKNTQRRRAGQKLLRFTDRQSHPAHREDAAKVTMRKEREVSVQGAKFRDEAVSARGYLFWVLPARTTVTEFDSSGCRWGV